MRDYKIASFSETSDKDWFREAFAELPNQVRTGRNRIGLLPPQMWARFLEFALPGASEFWVATTGNQAVGRIGANPLPSYPDTGAIGFFEIDVSIPDLHDVSYRLVVAAEKWLKEKGAKREVGPMNFNTWFPYRFRIDRNRETFTWEPNNPKPYPRIFTDLGFKSFEEYHSIGSVGLAEYVARTERNYIKCLSQGFAFRPFDVNDTLANDVSILFNLSMLGFKDSCLFEPVSFEVFRQLYVPIANRYNLSPCFFVLDPHGKEIGFVFCFFENNYLVFKTLTIHPDFRGLGLSNALTYLAGCLAVENGISRFVSALVRRGAQSESYSKKADTLWTHRYILFEKYL